MTNLLIACLLFATIHLFVSGTRVRDALVGVVGDGLYRGVFALASLAALVWMIVAYGQAWQSAENITYWVAPLWLLHAGSPIVLIALLFLVVGIATPNPTSVGGEAMSGEKLHAQGIVRITRHPFLWGIAIWAAFHL